MTDDRDDGVADSRPEDDERRRETVTALVVLRSAADPIERARLAGVAPSGEHLGALRPADDDVIAVTLAFQQLGVEVGPFLGAAMSITAPVGRIEALFGVRLTGGGGVWSLADRPGDPTMDVELPSDQLDGDLTGRIERIVIEPPMELHDEPTWTP